MQIPDQPKGAEEPEKIICHIHFPPEEALPDRAGAAVMIVMPALAESDQG